MEIITRFAPSPTGYLHIWGLRTVLFNYLFTKKNDGKFLLRVEDTDRTRFVEGSENNLLEILASMWLIPDEGPNNPWEKWPYRQSERLDIYSKYIKELIQNDHAYYCFCSPERLAELREEQQSLWLPTKYDKKCRYLSQDEIDKNLKANIPYTIRLKVPDNTKVEFQDQVRWKISINTADVDDQVLMKTDWFPTYHFAVVVDDHLMWITNIIRWDEWIPSTPKHVLLYQAFWWEIPNYSHVPPLIWMDGKKLSKRSWDVAVEKYLEKWYLVEALINYLALLWWNPKTEEEFFSIDDLIERFELSHVQKAGGVFDVDRLNFFNTHYLKSSDPDQLFNKLLTYLKRYDHEFYEILAKEPEQYNKNIFYELRTRIKHFSEYKNHAMLFYSEHKIAVDELFVNQKMKIESIEQVITAIELWVHVLKSCSDSVDQETLKNNFISSIKDAGLKNGQVLWPIRVSLSGEEFSPGAFEMIHIYWLEKSREILLKVLESLKKSSTIK